MKWLHLIHLAILIGLTASVGGQVAVTSSAGPSADTPKDLKTGIVVEKIKKASAADRAGIQAGDIILNWSGRDAKGQIESPFDLSEVEIEHGSRGTVVLEGMRGTEKLSWVVPPDAWDITTRPNVSGRLLELHLQA